MRTSLLTFVVVLGALVLLAVFGGPAPVKALEYGPDGVGPPGSGAAIELFRPEGRGPFPAVVVLHGCNGVARSTRRWAARLRDWGYVAALVDSFGPRGETNVCGRPGTVTAADRAGDARSAAALLAARPDVRRDRIGVIGFSHGASGVLDAAESGPFAAAVAFYPWCPARSGPLGTDALILIGDADDWTPSPRCTAYRERLGGARMSLTVYPGAVHAFDNGAPRGLYFGHQVGSDPAAAADAIARTRSFLAARLR